MVHKPKHKVHSFRNLLGDGGQDEINLERRNVNLAYRIVKLELMPNNLNSNQEACVKVFREKQTTLVFDFDFSDTDLLAAAYYTNASAADTYSEDLTVIFDNTLFSRNIYITHENNASGVKVNYYIELEEVPVGAATLMQLKLGVARKLNLQQD